MDHARLSLHPGVTGADLPLPTIPTFPVPIFPAPRESAREAPLEVTGLVLARGPAF